MSSTEVIYCVNCESDEVIRQVKIRGTAIIPNEGKAQLVDYEVERELFLECGDCGYRWDGESKGALKVMKSF